MAEVAAPRLPLDEDAGPPGADAQEPEEREHAAAPAEAESDDKRSAAAEADEKPTTSSEPTTTVHLSVPADAAGCVIGRGGCNIRGVTSVSGARVNVFDATSYSTQRTIQISGTVEQVASAQQLVHNLLKTYDPSKTPKSFTAANYKTRLCRHYVSGKPCPYGGRCHFAHGPHEIRPPPLEPNARMHPNSRGRAAGQRGGGGAMDMPPGNSAAGFHVGSPTQAGAFFPHGGYGPPNAYAAAAAAAAGFVPPVAGPGAGAAFSPNGGPPSAPGQPSPSSPASAIDVMGYGRPGDYGMQQQTAAWAAAYYQGHYYNVAAAHAAAAHAAAAHAAGSPPGAGLLPHHMDQMQQQQWRSDSVSAAPAGSTAPAKPADAEALEAATRNLSLNDTDDAGYREGEEGREGGAG